MKASEARENVKKANKEIYLFYKKYKIYITNYIDAQIADDSSEGLLRTSIETNELLYVLNKTIYPQKIENMFNLYSLMRILYNNIKKHYEKLGYTITFDNEFHIDWEENK